MELSRPAWSSERLALGPAPTEPISTPTCSSSIGTRAATWNSRLLAPGPTPTELINANPPKSHWNSGGRRGTRGVSPQAPRRLSQLQPQPAQVPLELGRPAWNSGRLAQGPAPIAPISTATRPSSIGTRAAGVGLGAFGLKPRANRPNSNANAPKFHWKSGGRR
jgi:hypothetical protein